MEPRTQVKGEEDQLRPKTIVYFERIIFGTLLLSSLRSYLGWDQFIGQPLAEDATLNRNAAAAIAITAIIFNYVLVGTLTLLVARRRSKIAMWVTIAWFAVILSVWFTRPPTADELLGSDTILSALQTIGQVVACALLFTPSARRWMRREDKLLDVFH